MSKVILYMAISADGFIAGNNDDVEWVGDDSWNSYLKFVKSCDIVIVGSRTFGMMEADEFVEGVKYLVATQDNDLDTGDFKKISIQSPSDMPQANKVGVIGGGELNGGLAKMGVIDEAILDVEPVTLGQGKQLFGSHDVDLKLKLMTTKKIGESTIQNHYEVVK